MNDEYKYYYDLLQDELKRFNEIIDIYIFHQTEYVETTIKVNNFIRANKANQALLVENYKADLFEIEKKSYYYSRAYEHYYIYMKNLDFLKNKLKEIKNKCK
jgi:hypothetical protein